MKIKYTIILILLSLLFIGACKRVETKLVSDIKQGDCSALTGIDKDTCLTTLAVEKKDASLCTQVVDRTTKDRCDSYMQFFGVT